MPDPMWLNRHKLPEFIASLDDLLDTEHSGLTKAQRDALMCSLDALLDLRDQKLTAYAPVDVGSLRGAVDANQCVEVVRAAVRDGVLDAWSVLQTILTVAPSTKEITEEVEALKTHITNLAEENETLADQLTRYEKLADALQEAMTAWQTAR